MYPAIERPRGGVAGLPAEDLDMARDFDFLQEQMAAVVEAELNQEFARTLGRYGRNAEEAIARCHQLLEAIESGDTSAPESYREARLEALDAVNGLCVQREMFRLFDHARVHEIYAVPPPIDVGEVVAAIEARARDDATEDESQLGVAESETSGRVSRRWTRIAAALRAYR